MLREGSKRKIFEPLGIPVTWRLRESELGRTSRPGILSKSYLITPACLPLLNGYMHELSETDEDASNASCQSLKVGFRSRFSRPHSAPLPSGQVSKLSSGNLGIVARLILGCNVKNL
jgi:hypothetical protein